VVEGWNGVVHDAHEPGIDGERGSEEEVRGWARRARRSGRAAMGVRVSGAWLVSAGIPGVVVDRLDELLGTDPSRKELLGTFGHRGPIRPPQVRVTSGDAAAPGSFVEPDDLTTTIVATLSIPLYTGPRHDDFRAPGTV
jgi:hypothetical protein